MCTVLWKTAVGRSIIGFIKLSSDINRKVRMNAKKLMGGRNSSMTLVNEEREGQVQPLKITALQNTDR
jgi:hypothetical protein